MKLRHTFAKKLKYNNKPTVVDDIRFDSIQEAKRYLYLRTLKERGEVLFFLMQVPFHLPGGVKYLADFVVFWANGDVTIEDVKGFKTDIYILKKKQVEALYNITITEI